jgi:hypothetical protein
MTLEASVCHSMRSAWQVDLVEREEVGMERALRR